MSQDAQFTHAHMVRFDRVLPGPVEKVWAVLTDTKWLPGWYGAGTIEPPGRRQVELMGGHIKGRRHAVEIRRSGSPTPGTSTIPATRSRPTPNRT